MTISRRTFLEVGASSAASLAMVGSLRNLGRLTGPLVTRGTDFEALRAILKGSVILPTDGPYERGRRVWSFNPRTDVRPAAIARCAEASDVVKCIAFAREHSVEIAVRGGGHDILGASSCDGGLVIDLSSMKRVVADVPGRTVVVEPGVLSGELKAATADAGLAPVLGCNPSVGVTGLTIGGGIGWFLGTHGAACDNLLSATVATADGNVLRANAGENPDLYWALRGGGGNFGVVTELEFQLHPIDAVVGGVIAFRQSDIRPFLRFYRDFMRHAPDELAVELSIFADPDPVIWAMVCWNGDTKKGLDVLRPLRTFATPAADTIDAVAWSRFLARMPQRTFIQTTNTYWRGGTASALSDALIDQFGAAVASAPRGWQLGIGHYMHGRISNVPDGATAFPRRAGRSTHFISASWREPSEADAAMTWVDETWVAFQHLSNSATYVNYLSESSESAVKAAYGDAYKRLALLKRRYDPDNVFHRNRNIRPSA